MTAWNAILVMVWTLILHLVHSAKLSAELKKIGPMIARKLWEDRAMRAKAARAVGVVADELKKAANE